VRGELVEGSMSEPYNPYAPPQADPLPAPSPGPFGRPQPWSPGEVLSIAWARFKGSWPVAVFAFFLTEVLTQMTGAVPTVFTSSGAIQPNSPAAGGLSLAFVALNLVVGSFLNVGLTRIFLQIARGETPAFGTLFSGADRLGPMLLSTILVGMVVGLGFVLLIVPGIVLALGLSLSQFYVVDADMGPMRAMKASWAATKGHKGDLLVLGLAAFGLILLGALMLLVGLLATMPIVYIALTVAYTRMSGIRPAPPLHTEGYHAV
jgi:uncharacterized membrane protein